MRRLAQAHARRAGQGAGPSRSQAEVGPSAPRGLPEPATDVPAEQSWDSANRRGSPAKPTPRGEFPACSQRARRDLSVLGPPRSLRPARPSVPRAPSGVPQTPRSPLCPPRVHVNPPPRPASATPRSRPPTPPAPSQLGLRGGACGRKCPGRRWRRPAWPWAPGAEAAAAAEAAEAARAAAGAGGAGRGPGSAGPSAEPWAGLAPGPGARQWPRWWRGRCCCCCSPGPRLPPPATAGRAVSGGRGRHRGSGAGAAGGAGL